MLKNFIIESGYLLNEEYNKEKEKPFNLLHVHNVRENIMSKRTKLNKFYSVFLMRSDKYY
jgi:hypothetical protein